MIIEARDIEVWYPGSSRPALGGVSVRAASGSFYAVLGPNGSGKSTLMKAILGVTKARSGQALVDGTPVEDWGRRDLARCVGAVTQSESIAFPLTTTQLVEMGRYPHLGALEVPGSEDRAAVENALEQCDLTQLRTRDVTTLSGGEFQRARIARALAQQPRALVLDEPTASLDVRHQMAILELLRRSADDGITVVLITHSLDRAAQFADRMLLLVDGLVAAEGGPDDVLDEDTLARVYGWPLSVRRDPLSGAHVVTPLRRDGPTA